MRFNYLSTIPVLCILLESVHILNLTILILYPEISTDLLLFLNFQINLEKI